MHDSDPAREARESVTKHLAELHRLHIALAADMRGLKRMDHDGHAMAEIEIAAGMIEQYMAATGAFLENMRGRFEARLPMLRRAEPDRGGGPGREAPGHGAFWYAFSRLCAALRQAERRVG
jgi:hypothetical protein